MRGTALLVVALLAPSTGASGTTGEGGAWVPTRLDLELTTAPVERLLAVEGTLFLRREGEPSSECILAVNGRDDLLRFVEVFAPPGASVEPNIRSNDYPFALLARVDLGRELPQGEELEIGFFLESTGTSGQFVVEERIAFASWTQAWYPMVADRSKRMAALLSVPGTTVLHLPPGWDAVSNGRLVGRETFDAGVRVAYEVEKPVARSFAAGPYRVVRHAIGEREVGVYLLPGTELDAKRQAELLGAALAAQEERLGPYPYSSYAIAEVPDDSGGFYASSEQGFIMAESSAFSWEHGNLPLWGHEMAHGWWGNLVGGRGPGSILCDESLAQYCAVLAIEGVEGREAATEFLRFSRSGYSSQQCARGYFELQRAGNDLALSRLESGGWHHTLSDAKGHWVYHMLRRRVGDERFFAGLRSLIADYAGSEMSLDDLRARFAELAPEAELETFFTQWLDRPGAPVLDLEWKPVGGDGDGDGDGGEAGVEVLVTQAQPGDPYHLHLPLEVVGAAGTLRHSLELRERETRAVLASPGPPTAVHLDPDHELLIWTPEYGERP